MFVALDLSDELRDGIVAWGGRELRDPALRVVAPEALHVTLAFLGYLPEKEIERLVEIVKAVDSPAPAIRLGDPIAKPTVKRARIIALPLISPGTVTLQAELEGKLVAAGLFKPEKRPFWPHLTVARVKSAGRGSKRPMDVSKLPGKLPRSLLEPKFKGIRTRLYRSELNPMGARYTSLAQVELS
ncbi:MAG: RNA 2',3'-cyclic phosphodiesterase [Thermoleophilia bacterium]